MVWLLLFAHFQDLCKLKLHNHMLLGQLASNDTMHGQKCDNAVTDMQGFHNSVWIIC